MEAGAGNLRLRLRVPEGLGGPGGEGTDPEELFAAAYAACFHSALIAAGRRRRVDLGEASVSTRVSIGSDADGRFRLAAEVRVHLPGVEEPVAEELIAAAHRLCPYSRALEGDCHVTVGLVPGPG